MKKNQKIYQSTRSERLTASSAQAVLQGIAPDGGLYTLRDFAQEEVDLQALLKMDTLPMAAEILSALLPDFSKEEMLDLVRAAYAGKFETPDLTPTVAVGEDAVLELFRGPTSAFKDVALSILPYLMRASAAKCGSQEEILILTATSGDTGKAAMEGFCDVPGTRIIVFYPDNGVSAVQKAQMTTQQGNNVCVCAVRGNFDDAQTGVKQIFSRIQQENPLTGKNIRFSSANSINIGRLAPQVVYYFSAYKALLDAGRIRLGEPVDFCVPTGNFGDILAGFIAKQMGLPAGRLVCASNANNVLTDFLRTGVYDRRRPFHLTVSPSMDILVSSNLERLLYLLSGDAKLVSELMAQLSAQGHYQVPAAMLEKIRSLFWAGFCDDDATCRTIGQVWRDHRYLCDTHTAVAWHVAQQYKAANPDHNQVVILSTASPYKFPEAVLRALSIPQQGSGFDAMLQLEAATGVPIPANLRGLDARPVRHQDVIDRENMLEYVLDKAVNPSWHA
ncbi:MAG: threonine synthase [Clostridia bacterium]|nr:threonine synthase [Clostridia bacterium]